MIQHRFILGLGISTGASPRSVCTACGVSLLSALALEWAAATKIRLEGTCQATSKPYQMMFGAASARGAASGQPARAGTCLDAPAISFGGASSPAAPAPRAAGGRARCYYTDLTRRQVIEACVRARKEMPDGAVASETKMVAYIVDYDLLRKCFAGEGKPTETCALVTDYGLDPKMLKDRITYILSNAKDAKVS